MKYIQFPLVLLTILMACNFLTACSDDDGGGIPRHPPHPSDRSSKD